ncbi:MAG: gamma-glutamyl-gamma-aminobutyrate hydrolase family protein [Bdellovibrionales bacterium]
MGSYTMPLVGVPTNQVQIDGFVYSRTAHRFILPLLQLSGVLPVLIPALGDDRAAAEALERLDGLYLTGAVSNVAPSRYGDEMPTDCAPFDLARDHLAFALAKSALGRGMPLFGVCRGMQELNVVCGGTLVNVPPSDISHGHGGGGPDLTERLGAVAHPATVQAGGFFEKWFGCVDLGVNSLHGQGVGRVGHDLHVEAVAPDGIVEAVSHKKSPFAVAVEWHPEWDAANNPVSRKLFEEFGSAVRTYAAARGSV